MTSFERQNPKAKRNKQQPFIQAKLTIGQPNDPYEQEADRVAEQVMRMPESDAPVQRICEECEEPAVARAMADGESLQMKPLAEGISSFVQMQHNGGDGDTEKKGINNIEKALQILEDKKLSPEEKLILLKDMNFELEELPRFIHDPSLLLPLKKLEDEELPIDPFFDELYEETKPDDEEPRVIAHNEEKEVLQAKPAGGGLNASSALESCLSSKKGQGQPLPEGTQQSMSRAFGTDFGGVKVHTDNEAVQMNRELGAKAFTHGSDIYFNAGQYNPGGREGKKLLGHELTHVVQQGGERKALQRSAMDYEKDPPIPRRKKNSYNHCDLRERYKRVNKRSGRIRNNGKDDCGLGDHREKGPGRTGLWYTKVKIRKIKPRKDKDIGPRGAISRDYKRKIKVKQNGTLFFNEWAVRDQLIVKNRETDQELSFGNNREIAGGRRHAIPLLRGKYKIKVRKNVNQDNSRFNLNFIEGSQKVINIEKKLLWGFIPFSIKREVDYVNNPVRERKWKSGKIPLKRKRK